MDAFQNRVLKVPHEVETKQASERERRKCASKRCKTEDELLDIQQWASSNRGFTFQIDDVRANQNVIEDELDGLRECFAMSANIDIPSHPRKDSDQKHSKRQSRRLLSFKARMLMETGCYLLRKNAKMAGHRAAISTVTAFTATNALDDDVITQKPTQLEETQAVRANDDWDWKQDNVANIKKGTASGVTAGNEIAYMELYLRKIGDITH